MKIGFSSFTFPYLSSLSLSTAGNLPLPPRYFPSFPSLLSPFLPPYFPSSSSLLPLFFLLTSPLLPTYFPSSSLFPSFLSSSFPHYLFSLVPFSPLTLFLPPTLGFSLSSSPLIFFPSCLSFLSSCPHSRISPFLQYLSSLSSLFSYFVLRFQLAPFLLPFH